jgi:hypothetical protein
MTRAPSESAAAVTDSADDAGWPGRLKVSAFLLLYTTGLWGQAGRLLPPPFDDWHGVPYRLLAPWWHAHVLPQLAHSERVALFQVVEGYLLALALPLLALRSLGITAREAGLGRAHTRGVVTTAAGVLLALPVGFWLATATPEPWGTPLQEALEFLCIVPEHFLIFGVFGVLLLPERRLRWLSRQSGQTAAGVFTLAAATLVFGLVHVGTPHPAELVASFPLGLLFAAMTLLSGSIWPAVTAHVTLNLFPMALLPVGG